MQWPVGVMLIEDVTWRVLIGGIVFMAIAVVAAVTVVMMVGRSVVARGLKSADIARLRQWHCLHLLIRFAHYKCIILTKNKLLGRKFIPGGQAIEADSGEISLRVNGQSKEIFDI